MAVVKANMRVCDKTHIITAKKCADGDVEIRIESDCPKITSYGERIGKLSLLDIIDYKNSKINNSEIRGDVSPTCIAPTAIFNAAWLEMDMLSKTLAQRVKENSIEFL